MIKLKNVERGHPSHLNTKENWFLALEHGGEASPTLLPTKMSAIVECFVSYRQQHVQERDSAIALMKTVPANLKHTIVPFIENTNALIERLNNIIAELTPKTPPKIEAKESHKRKLTFEEEQVFKKMKKVLPPQPYPEDRALNFKTLRCLSCRKKYYFGSSRNSTKCANCCWARVVCSSCTRLNKTTKEN